jgi:hypothetical protein
MKFSNEEKKLAEFLMNHRNMKLNDEIEIENNLKPLKNVLVDNVKDIKIVEKIVELLKYLNKLEYIPCLEIWPIPIFPITGEHLERKSVTKGPLYSKILNSLKEIWKNEFNFDVKETTIELLLKKCDEMLLEK